MSSKKHSLFSASAAHRWANCPGALVMSEGKSSPPNIHSAKGTVAHSILEEYLTKGRDPYEWVGEIVEQDGFEIEVDEDMADAVKTAIASIEAATAGALVVWSETEVDYSHALAMPAGQAWGTADVIAIKERLLQVHDFKNGHRPVEAENNEQLVLYAAGALAQVEDVIDAPIEDVEMYIHQPAVSDTPSVWKVPIDKLRRVLDRLRSAANSAVFAKQEYGRLDRAKWEELALRPGEKQCQWCPARGTCPAARRAVESSLVETTAATPEEFLEPDAGALSVEDWVKAHNDPAWLAAVLARADFIEGVLSAVRAEADRMLQAGVDVPGFKLVQGKRGARAWADKDAAEKYLRETVRLPIEDAYNLKLISPTQAEKLAKAEKIGPRQWKKMQENIVQPDGKLHVAPVGDPRPQITVKAVSTEFTPVVEDDNDIG